MAALMTTEDLLALADTVGSLTEVTRRTGVAFDGYGDSRITLRGHVIRLAWDAERSAYLVEFPDATY